MTKFFAPLLALGLLGAQPASALTWAEFWEPFTEEHHHHHHSHRPRRRPHYEVHRPYYGPVLHKHAGFDGHTRDWHPVGRKHHVHFDPDFVGYCSKITRYKKWVHPHHHEWGHWSHWTKVEEHPC